MVIVPPKATGRKRTKAETDSDQSSCSNGSGGSSTASPIAPSPSARLPMITATNIHYELGQRVHGLAAGGIGAMLLVARAHRA